MLIIHNVKAGRGNAVTERSGDIGDTHEIRKAECLSNTFNVKAWTDKKRVRKSLKRNIEYLSRKNISREILKISKEKY